MRTMTRLLLLGAVLTCAAGCGGGKSTSDDGASPPILVAPASDGGPAAQVAGEVVVVGGCLALRSATGDFVVVWPAGTVRGSVPTSVVVPGVGELGVGDRVDGGGGYYASSSLLADYPRLAECELGPDDEVAILNPLS